MSKRRLSISLDENDLLKEFEKSIKLSDDFDMEDINASRDDTTDTDFDIMEYTREPMSSEIDLNTDEFMYEKPKRKLPPSFSRMIEEPEDDEDDDDEDEETEDDDEDEEEDDDDDWKEDDESINFIDAIKQKKRIQLYESDDSESEYSSDDESIYPLSEEFVFDSDEEDN